MQPCRQVVAQGLDLALKSRSCSWRCLKDQVLVVSGSFKQARDETYACPARPVEFSMRSTASQYAVTGPCSISTPLGRRSDQALLLHQAQHHLLTNVHAMAAQRRPHAAIAIAAVIALEDVRHDAAHSGIGNRKTSPVVLKTQSQLKAVTARRPTVRGDAYRVEDVCRHAGAFSRRQADRNCFIRTERAPDVLTKVTRAKASPAVDQIEIESWVCQNLPNFI